MPALDLDKPVPKRAVLFICTHNSARSQMAEALLRHHLGDQYDAFSAGTEATQVKKQALIVLAERGMETRGLFSKTIDHFGDRCFDVVVTVCDDAKEHCPYHPGTVRTIHQSFPDPSDVGKSVDENLEAFRNTRDAIQNWILDTFGK